MVDLIREVEAILFASAKRITIDEILALIDKASKKKVEVALKELQKNYEDSETSICLIQDSDFWKLSLKQEYLPIVEKLMPSTELPAPVVETLAILAWKAPMLQSELVHIRSPVVYDHISELEKLKLITRVKHGRSYIIKLTENFYDYFDVPEKAVEELVKDFKEPVLEEEEMIESETEEQRKQRLMKEIEENKIDPQKIIGKDKEYLKQFDEKLDEIDSEMRKAVIPKEDSEQVKELVEPLTKNDSLLHGSENTIDEGIEINGVNNSEISSELNEDSKVQNIYDSESQEKKNQDNLN